MVATLRVIGNMETNIEFTTEEVAALDDMPGKSLGHLVVFIDQMEKLFKLEPIPTQYKDGFIDRTFKCHHAAKLMLHAVNDLSDKTEEDLGKDEGNRKIWSWIWHILKDEYKFNAYVIDTEAGEINIDIDNTVSSETD